VTETRDDRQTNPSQEELENSFEWARPKADFLIAELTLPFRDRRPLVVPGDEIAPFSVSRGGAEIEVTPAFRIQELTGGPMTWLDELKAIVSRQIDPTLPLRTIVDQVVEPGREVLHQTLRHLREVVDDPRIDVHLDGLRLEFFEGPERSTSGLGLFEAIANLRLQKRGIDHGYWRAVIKAVVSNQRIPMERELVLDAERYLADGNHHFALLYAAFAGERLVFRLLYEALQATGKYQRAEAQKVAEGVSKADAARLLLNFYEIPLDTLRAIEKAFEERNHIVHSQARYRTAREPARRAVQAAIFLEGLMTSAAASAAAKTSDAQSDAQVEKLLRSSANQGGQRTTGQRRP